MKYETVISLEVHVEMATETKIFCSCKNEFGSEPNTNVCPVCLSMPGTLPVLNEQAVEYGVRAGLSLNCNIPNYSKLDRKGYFYPDLAKAYQISQYDFPLCGHGEVEVEADGEKHKIGIKMCIRDRLMTMHAAKGLEFDTVFIAGMDEAIFPSQRAIDEDNIEEERRLCYVAVTSAKRKLYMLHSNMRTLYGRTQPSVRSRFLDEIDDSLLNEIGKKKPVISAKQPASASERKGLFSGGFGFQKKAVPQKVSGDYKIGTIVEHKTFGRGKVKSIAGEGDSRDVYKRQGRNRIVRFSLQGTGEVLPFFFVCYILWPVI